MAVLNMDIQRWLQTGNMEAWTGQSSSCSPQGHWRVSLRMNPVNWTALRDEPLLKRRSRGLGLANSVKALLRISATRICGGFSLHRRMARITRFRDPDLYVPPDDPKLLLEIAMFITKLVVSHLFTGKFKHTKKPCRRYRL